MKEEKANPVCSGKKKVIQLKRFRRERKEKGKRDSFLNHCYISDKYKESHLKSHLKLCHLKLTNQKQRPK